MKENCAECKHHDVFGGGSGCNLLNNGENCKFEPCKQLSEQKAIINYKKLLTNKQVCGTI